MVLLFSGLPSSCSSSQRADTECDSMVRLPSTESFFASSPLPSSDNDYSIYRYRSQPIQFRLDEFGTDMDSEDDDCSESSSVSSDGASSFDSRSVCSMPNEMDYLNEHRREMLHLSISKIQTMNASNVPVSLRKSLLIYNTMKSLQRDLNECGDDVYGSLIEGSGVSPDDEMLEEEENHAGHWDCEREQGVPTPFREQPSDYCWPWSDPELSVDSPSDVIQDLELRGGGLSSTTRTSTGNGNSFWTGGATSFIDDYLGMWGAWEDEDYNPLTNCNLSQAEILHMFGPPSHHVNSQLLSQA